jgi:hypothetical protein
MLDGTTGAQMIKVYICHAYGADPAGNGKKVAAICRAIKNQPEFYHPSMCVDGRGMTRQYLPIAPQIYLDRFVDETTERRLAMNYCLDLLQACNELWIFGPTTAGMRQEIAQARSRSQRIRRMRIAKDGRITDKDSNGKSHFLLDSKPIFKHARTAKR